jgi:hypothetical protein
MTLDDEGMFIEQEERAAKRLADNDPEYEND